MTQVLVLITITQAPKPITWYVQNAIQAPIAPHKFATGSLCTATMCDGGSAESKESSAMATNNAMAALEIQMILEEKSAEDNDAATLERLRRVLIALVPIDFSYRRGLPVWSIYFLELKQKKSL
tara:strand:+ start:271 stop:642 length:372 start_codon:yes stop_codon:yes gene_type:complete